MATISLGSELHLSHQGSLRAGSEPAPNLKPVICILTAKEPAIGQENWI